MKHMAHISAGLLILLLVLQPYTVQGSDITRTFDKWMEHFRQLLNWRPKRECSGYMCSYSHMSSSAGSRAKHNALMRFLHSCAQDPTCSPGKRRRRSTWSLSQSQALSRKSPFLGLLKMSLAKS